MSTGLSVFDRTVQETNLWLSDLEKRLHSSRHQAYGALRATLHALRDRLPPETAMHFAAQLPMLLRGLFAEGWRLSDGPLRPRTAEAFLDEIAAELAPGFPFSPATVARQVFQTLRDRMDVGEVDEVLFHLPRRVRELWMEDVL